MQIHELTASQLKEKLSAKELSSVDITKHYLARIQEDDKQSDKINAFIDLYEEDAIKRAEEADKKIASGSTAPMLGIPVALKDNLNRKGFPTTCASKILEGYQATFTATAVSQLEEAGAVILGRTNMDEFAMGSSNETSHRGIVRNPVDRERIPGGSSGGSAAAVAAQFSPFALGSDTGGSIRQPAALCGVVGLKPTYGRVSRYGLVAFASSLDQIGTFAADTKDSALLLNSIAGYDAHDSTSANVAVPDHTADLAGDLKGKKIGVPKEFFVDGMDPEVLAAVEAQIAKAKELGAEIIDISLPHTEYGTAVYYIVATAEASSNLARFDGIRYGYRNQDASNLLELFSRSRDKGFGSEVKRRILLGTYVLSSGYYDAYYLKALKARTLIKQDFEKAFQQVDAIITPTTPTPAFKIGEKMDDPVSMYLSDIFTISTNLAGIPALSMPATKSSTGLPIGVQLMGNYFKEHDLLKIAHRLEQG